MDDQAMDKKEDSKARALTRAALAKEIYKKIGFSYSESSRLLESVIEQVAGALARGEKVKLLNLGSFQVYEKRPRVGRNPKTGEEVTIPKRRVVSFRPSQVLKQRANRDSGGKIV